MDLVERSKAIILANQSRTGSYVASPSFNNYRYSWFRDGSFIAYAMLINGEEESCGHFLNWAHRTIMRNSSKVDHVIRCLEENREIADGDFLPARYTLDGVALEDEWPNHQIDGYGTWLWCLAEYIKRAGKRELLHTYSESIRYIIRYLTAVWQLPHHDCWEEFGDRVHPATLACVFGGLKSINAALAEQKIQEIAESIRLFVLHNGIVGNRVTKSIGVDMIDASLLWVTVPFDMIDSNDEIMRETVGEIERRLLVRNGGVKRYCTDTYFGGGEWIILTCWLAWYYLKVGKTPKALRLISWIEEQQDEMGNLPEQVLENANDPASIILWENKWGKAANPLLWSHAMYLIVKKELLLITAIKEC